MKDASIISLLSLLLTAAAAVGQTTAPEQKKPAGAAPAPVASPAPAAKATPAAGIVLPFGESIEPQTLRVSAPLQKVVYVARNTPGSVKGFVVDLKTGKATEIARILDSAELQAVSSVEISADGKKLCLLAKIGDKNTIYVIDLAAGTNTTLGEYTGYHKLCWLGNQLVFSNTDGQGSISTYRLIDPETGKNTPSSVYGTVLSADPSGTRLVLLVDTINPGKKTDAVTMRAQGSVASADAEGKIVKAFGAPGTLASLPMISPLGTYVAFTAQPKTAARATSLLAVRWLTTDGMEVRTLREAAWPAAAMESEQLLTVGVPTPSKPGPLKLWAKEGEAKTLDETARDAAVAEGIIYYVSGDARPVLKIMPLPEK